MTMPNLARKLILAILLSLTLTISTRMAQIVYFEVSGKSASNFISIILTALSILMFVLSLYLVDRNGPNQFSKGRIIIASCACAFVPILIALVMAIGRG